MKVLVDTCVWSLALRRKRKDLSVKQKQVVSALDGLIRAGRVNVIGPIRQELLSGLRDEAQFERLREHLRVFDQESLSVDDFEEAARCHNTCRAAGIAGSAIDFLICAAALRRGIELFTVDEDFPRYATRLPLRFFSPEAQGGS